VLIRYARTLAGRQPIDDALFADLAAQFSQQQIIDICLLVGVQTLITFFNKTFLADIDEEFIRYNQQADDAAGSPPISYPPVPR
jgi:hypothetical protein